MSIIRTVKREQFLVVHMATVEDTSIDLDCKGLHVYLLGKPNNWEVNVKHIMREFRVGRKKVYRILNDLIAAGYCKRVQDRTHGAFDSCTYEIYETKQQNEHASPCDPQGHTVPTEPCARKGDAAQSPINSGIDGDLSVSGGAQKEPCAPEGHAVRGVQNGSSATSDQDVSQQSSTVCPLGVYPSGAHITNNKYITNKPLSHNSVVSDRSQRQEVTGGGGEREKLSVEKNNNPQSLPGKPPEHDQQPPEQPRLPAPQAQPVASSKAEPATLSPEQAHREAFEAAAPDRQAIGEPPHGVVKPIRGESFCPPGWVSDLWHDWVEHRESLKPYSEIQKFFDCGYLANFIKAGWGQAEVLENSIARGFLRLHPPCAPGKEKETLAARQRLTEQNKTESNGKGAGVGENDVQEKIRELRQSIRGYNDTLRLMNPDAPAAQERRALVKSLEEQLKSLGGTQCS